MLEVANLLSSIFVTPITELCIPALKSPIGYIVHCEENLKQLKEKVEELKGIRDVVQVRVTAAERNLESIHEVVKVWLGKVENETSTTRDNDQKNILALVMNNDDDAVLNLIINTKCWCWCSAGGSSRYSLGKSAKKKLITIEKLLTEGSGFISNTISEPCVAMRTNPIPTNNRDDIMSFASRDNLRDQVMVALQNEGTNLIGVHGMGGVGKTTFVSQVYEQMKKKKNLFDDVVMVKNITKDVDLKKIQNDIADCLGFGDIKNVDNTLNRAEMLFERLKKKRTLVILDDLWSHLNFTEVGIPWRGSCKVIITTRRLEVCTLLGSQVNIKIDGLSEVDSWHLFKKMNVGDLAYPSNLEETAREIAKECGGLPVSLVTLAKGLREKDMSVWNNTLRQLKYSKIPHIEEIEGKVYTPIKLSYDYLEKSIFKICFLLCSLFPGAHEIHICDLMEYLIADDDMMSEDDWTLKQMTDEVSTILAKLVDSSLLLRKEISNSPGLSTVSMHDVIRDVAINIASEEGNGFLVKAGLGLKHWPRKSLSSITTGKCLHRLSLMKNEISRLPDDSPELPRLLSLSLYGNRSLLEIPNSFFERMESLATLDLQQTGISFLPSSFSSLVNLKTLYLDGCKFNQPSDINVIGKLKKLELLSLAYCGLLSGLPEELRGLTNLRLLHVGSIYPRIFTIPRNVIGSLSRLEYLNTRNCEISWEFEGWGNGKNASLEEVASLRYLSGLFLDYDVDVSKENLKCGHVKEFFISFFDATGFLMMPSGLLVAPIPSSYCCVDVSPPICHPIKVLIQRVEILSVLNGGLKSLGQLGGGFNNLKELDVEDCKEMEYLMSAEEAESSRPFVALEKLTLSSLDKLKEIFDDNSGIRSAPNLKSLKVSDCKGLKDVFNLNNNIEEVGLSDVATFSRLRKMELFGLSILENIWKGHNIPFGYFENLEELRVSNCEKLRYLFSLSMARNLQNLKLLQISNCENLKQLWEKENDVDVDGDDDDDDDNDDQVASRASILDFPALESLKVLWCKNLKRICLTHQCTKQLKEIKVDDDEWRIKWEEPSDKLRLQSLFQQLESIPDMAQGVWSDNFELQLEFTTQFRKFLSSENFDRIEKVTKACVVPRFVEFLERQDLPQLQNEAAWALTKITSGTSKHSQVAIDHDDVRKKALSDLGCIDGGTPNFDEHSKLSMLRNATRTVSNFCEGKPPLPFEQVKLVLLALRHLIHSTDEQVLTDACRALYHLSNGDKIHTVIDAGIIPRLVDLFHHPSNGVVSQAFQTVGKIILRGDDAQKKQYVLDNYQVLIPCLYQLITQNPDENIKFYACWAISNIISGKNNRGHRIQAVIDANIFPSLVHLLQHAESVRTKLMSAYTIKKAISGGSREQIEYLVNQGCIKPLCDHLVYPDPDCIILCIKVLENILKVGEENKELGKNNGVNIYAQMIDECKGLDKIRKLQSHDDNEVKEKAVKILERYWFEDE